MPSFQILKRVFASFIAFSAILFILTFNIINPLNGISHGDAFSIPVLGSIFVLLFVYIALFDHLWMMIRGKTNAVARYLSWITWLLSILFIYLDIYLEKKTHVIPTAQQTFATLSLFFSFPVVAILVRFIESALEKESNRYY